MVSAYALLLISLNLVLYSKYFRSSISLDKLCELVLFSFSLLFFLSSWIVYGGKTISASILLVLTIAPALRYKTLWHSASQYIRYLSISIGLSSDSFCTPLRPYKWLLSTSRVTTTIFIVGSLAISLASQVTNGDSQVYNISRIYTSILSGNLLLDSTSIPTQAFHSIGHDYLYSFDIIWNNLRGLSLLNLVEAVLILVIVDRILIVDQQSSSEPYQSQRYCARCIARIILVSMPSLFYQSTTTKNDLILALLGLTISILSARALSRFRSCSFLMLKADHLPLIKQCLPLLIAWQFCVLCKGYGIILVVLSFLTGLLVFFLLVRPERRVSIASGYIWSEGAPLASSLPIVVLLAYATAAYYIHVNDLWTNEFTQFAVKHGPSTILDLLKAFPVNFLRTLFESAVNLPFPISVEPFKGLPLINTTDFIALGEIYSFGGVVNEDIAWPGLLFSISAGVSICYFLSRSYHSIFVPRGSIFLPDRYLISLIGFGSSILMSLGLVACLYWQPYSSRFFIAPSILVVPFFALIISSLARRRLHFKASAGKCSRTIVFSLIGTGLMLGLGVSISKQAYVGFRQVMNPDYYIYKSMHASRASLESIVGSLVGSQPEVVAICARNQYSASLYLMQQLYSAADNGRIRLIFPKNSDCDLSAPSVPILYYGNGKPPSL